MIGQAWKWLNERWPLSTLLKLALDEDIPGGSSYAYTLGSAIMTIISIQIATGIMQLFFYVPTVDHAYDSLNYLRLIVPFGWLIHNLHYWGAQAMIAVVVLHMSRVFIWGAYKKPRELTWLFGVGLLLVTMGLSFTGSPLAWDQAGYWAAEVGTSIPGSIPFVGDLTVNLMRGGPDMGQLTISRFFTLHVIILPLTLLALVFAHLIALRTSGAAGPWEELRRRTSEQFWPYQAFKDTMTASGIVIGLIALSVFLPPGFTGAADPLSSTFTPKPEWNFLFLYQALKYFKGPLEPLGVAGVPAVLVLLLVALPFIDRNAERNPLKRPVALSLAGIMSLTLMVLTIAGHVSKPASTEQTIIESTAGAVSKIRPATPDSITKGAMVYQSSGCSACHKINGTGGSVGPDLSNEASLSRTRNWLTIQIRTPRAHFPGTVMPSFSRLPEADMNELVDYLSSLRHAPQQGPAAPSVPAVAAPVAPAMPSAANTPAAASVPARVPGAAADIIGSAEQGKMLFDRQCVSCHANAGKGGIANPGSDDKFVPPLNPIDGALFRKNAREFASGIDRYIQHGSRPEGPSPRVVMPAFGDSNALSQQQISNIEAYVLKLNGVDRTEPVNPGIRPLAFFFIAVPVFLVIMFIAGGIYRCLPDNAKMKDRDKDRG